jgi:hypothetical protein
MCLWNLVSHIQDRTRIELVCLFVCLFVNRLLKRVFGSKRDKVTGAWRKLHNEEVYNWYSSQITRARDHLEYQMGG